MVNEKLNEVAEGDIDLMIELLEIYFSQESKAKKEMLELASSNDWQRIAKISHRFQPSVVYVGLASVSEKLKLLENIIIEKHSEEAIQKLFFSMIEDLAKARAELHDGYEKLVRQRNH